MHLYITTRGIKDAVNKWINDLSAQWYPYPLKKGVTRESLKKFYPNGVPEPTPTSIALQMAVRPIQFWELAFPKNDLQSVQKMIWGKNGAGNQGWKFKALYGAMRKMLGAKKVPKFDENVQQRYILKNDFVGVDPIGIKDDKEGEFGEGI